LLASTETGAWVLDPCCGSSTTGIAASLLGRRFLGIDIETEYLDLARRRREEIDNPTIADEYRSHLKDLQALEVVPAVQEPISMGYELPF